MDLKVPPGMGTSSKMAVPAGSVARGMPEQGLPRRRKTDWPARGRPAVSRTVTMTRPAPGRVSETLATSPGAFTVAVAVATRPVSGSSARTVWLPRGTLVISKLPSSAVRTWRPAAVTMADAAGSPDAVNTNP
jgi:hypothetical protein